MFRGKQFILLLLLMLFASSFLQLCSAKSTEMPKPSKPTKMPEPPASEKPSKPAGKPTTTPSKSTPKNPSGPTMMPAPPASENPSGPTEKPVSTPPKSTSKNPSKPTKKPVTTKSTQKNPSEPTKKPEPTTPKSTEKPGNSTKCTDVGFKPPAIGAFIGFAFTMGTVLLVASCFNIIDYCSYKSANKYERGLTTTTASSTKAGPMAKKNGPSTNGSKSATPAPMPRPKPLKNKKHK